MSARQADLHNGATPADPHANIRSIISGSSTSLNKQGPHAGRILLLGSAYAPAAAIVGCRTLPDVIGWVALSLGAGGIALWIAFLVWLETKAQPREVIFESFSPIDGEVTGYIASYLLPVAAASSPSCGDLVAYALCGALILMVAFAADLGSVNPVVYFLGFRVARASTTDGPVIVLFRATPPLDDPVVVTRSAGVVIVPEAQEDDKIG